jgi:uncharacterized protein (TIGR03435 family)
MCILATRSIAAVVTLLALALSSALHAQSSRPPGSASAFEVASVKPNKSASTSAGIMPRGRQLVVTNVPVRVLIATAYQIRSDQVAGGPGWIASDRFDIVGTLPENASLTQFPPMLKTLLAERFKLVAHRETRQLPVYALVKARRDGRLGPQLSRSEADCAALRAAARGRGSEAATFSLAEHCGSFMGAGLIEARGITMEALAQLLINLAGRPVSDSTGLTGGFDFKLQFAPEAAHQPGAPAANEPSASNAPSIYTALQEQLGLKLRSERGPVEVLVIDSVEKPTED